MKRDILAFQLHWKMSIFFIFASLIIFFCFFFSSTSIYSITATIATDQAISIRAFYKNNSDIINTHIAHERMEPYFKQVIFVWMDYLPFYVNYTNIQLFGPKLPFHKNHGVKLWKIVKRPSHISKQEEINSLLRGINQQKIEFIKGDTRDSILEQLIKSKDANATIIGDSNRKPYPPTIEMIIPDSTNSPILDDQFVANYIHNLRNKPSNSSIILGILLLIDHYIALSSGYLFTNRKNDALDWNEIFNDTISRLKDDQLLLIMGNNGIEYDNLLLAYAKNPFLTYCLNSYNTTLCNNYLELTSTKKPLINFPYGALTKEISLLDLGVTICGLLKINIPYENQGIFSSDFIPVNKSLNLIEAFHMMNWQMLLNLEQVLTLSEQLYLNSKDYEQINQLGNMREITKELMKEFSNLAHAKMSLNSFSVDSEHAMQFLSNSLGFCRKVRELLEKNYNIFSNTVSKPYINGIVFTIIIFALLIVAEIMQKIGFERYEHPKIISLLWKIILISLLLSYIFTSFSFYFVLGEVGIVLLIIILNLSKNAYLGIMQQFSWKIPLFCVILLSFQQIALYFLRNYLNCKR